MKPQLPQRRHRPHDNDEAIMPPRKRGQPELQFNPLRDIFAEFTTLYTNVSDAWTELHGEEEGHRPDKVIKDRRKFVEDAMRSATNGEVHVYEHREGEDARQVSNHTAERLIRVFLLYNNELCLSAIDYYVNGVTSSIRNWAFERAIRAETDTRRRKPFDHTVLMNTMYPSDTDALNAAALEANMSDSRVKTGTWQHNFTMDARGFVNAFAIHVINHVAYLAWELHNAGPTVETAIDATHVYNCVWSLEIHRGQDETELDFYMQYERRLEQDNAICTVWTDFLKPYIAQVETLTNAVLDQVPAGRCKVVKLQKTTRRMLKADNLLTPSDLFKAFFSRSENSARIGSLFLEALYNVAVRTNAVQPARLYGGRLSSDEEHILGQGYGRLIDSVVHCYEDITLADRRYIIHNRASIIQAALDDFKTRRRVTYDRHYAPRPTQESVRGMPRDDIVRLLPESNADVAPTSNTGRLCYTCEQAWPPTKDWPPQRSKVVDGVRVTIERIEEPVSVAQNTRAGGPVRRRMSSAIGPSTQEPTPQHIDIIDALEAADGRTDEERRAALRTVLEDILHRTHDLPDAHDIYRAVITAEEARIQEATAAAAAAQAKREERARLKTQQDRLAAAEEASRRRRAQDMHEAERVRLDEDGRLLAAATTGSNGEREVRNATEATMMAQQRPDIPEQAPPPAPPLPPPPAQPAPPAQQSTRQPPPAPSAHITRRVPLIHRWIPTSWGNNSLHAAQNLYDAIWPWGLPLSRAMFNENNVWTQDEFEDALQLPLDTAQDFVGNMPIIYAAQADYHNLWCAIIFISIHEQFRAIAVDPATWARTAPPEQLTVPSSLYDHGVGPGPDGFQVSNDNIDTDEGLVDLYRWVPANTRVQRIRPVRVGDICILRFYTGSFAPAHSGDQGTQRHIINTHNESYLSLCVEIDEHADPHGVATENREAYTFKILGCATAIDGARALTLRSRMTVYASVEVAGYIGNEARGYSALGNICTSGDTRFLGLLLNQERPLVERLENIDDRWRQMVSRPEITARYNPDNPQNHTAPQWLHTYLSDTYNYRFADELRPFFDRVHAHGDHVPEPVDGNHSMTPCNTTQLMAMAHILYTPGGMPRDNNIYRDFVKCVIGPPGTGKTRTLLHSLSAQINRREETRAAILAMRRQVDLFDANAEERQRETIARAMRAIPTGQVPRILIVTPTHKALNVIESKLLDGVLHVQDTDNDRWLRTVPLYRRVAYPPQHKRDTSLDERRNNALPESIHSRYSNFITLSTLGSAHLAFRQVRDVTAPRYTHVYIDEASQVSEIEICILFWELLIQSDDNEHIPIITFLGDPLQQPPNAQGQPSAFKLIQQCAFFERLIAAHVPSCPGVNTARTICLDIQYRMHPQIVGLVNLISNRQVQSAISDSTPWMSEGP